MQQNLSMYGYGIKSFTLSMIETALRISDKTASLEVMEKILGLGKEMLNKPVVLLEGVEEVLAELQGKYRIVMATKGDLLDQERKLGKSGLEKFFHHIEIMSEKKEPDFQKLIKHLDIPPQEFVIIGNSLKSDILPVLNLGGYGFHIPYQIHWELDKIDAEIKHDNFRRLEKISDVLEILLINSINRSSESF